MKKPNKRPFTAVSTPKREALRLAAHALRWAAFGYRKPADQHAVGAVRLWLLEQAGPLPPRQHVLAETLELFAITTSSFYKTHMNMAHTCQRLPLWRHWVRRHVLYIYWNEIGPAWAMPVEIHRAARALRNYYAERVRESNDRRV